VVVRAIITDLIIIGEAVDKIPKNIKYNYHGFYGEHRRE
jgi:uncharacterized protein with HEPN domain